MTQKKNNAKTTDWKEVFGSGPDGLRALVQEVVQEVLEAEMDEAVGAQKSERSADRVGYRAGHYTRTLVTRVGKLVLRVPQDRQGRFRTEVFERYQRSEKALVSALTEMYVQGVSTRSQTPTLNPSRLLRLPDHIDVVGGASARSAHSPQPRMCSSSGACTPARARRR